MSTRSYDSTSIFATKKHPRNCEVSLSDACTLTKYADDTFVTESAKIEFCSSKGVDYAKAVKYIPVVESMTRVFYSDDDCDADDEEEDEKFR